mmetsp:Transcript_5142/g.11329  ORF Transcript_5142/g.11329 Transcript_5142/m.11329 type:complete len:83 (-) Transcript_5142:31-279(-)
MLPPLPLPHRKFGPLAEKVVDMVHDFQHGALCHAVDFVHFDFRQWDGVDAGGFGEECGECGHGGDQFCGGLFGILLVCLFEC